MSNYIYHFIFFLSGISGLGYEIIWTKMFATSLGHEIVSVLAVVTAFFGGLACGAWVLDKPLSMSSRPGVWYGLLEFIIGVWGVLLLFVIPATNPLVSGLIGVEPDALRHWTVSFLYPFILLFPATFAMGGTLPAMDRFYSRARSEEGGVSGLYGINTLGAVAAILLFTYALIPGYGLPVATILLVICNFCLAAASVGLDNKFVSAPDREPADSSHTSVANKYPYLAILFITGMAGIGFEVLMVRGISQILDNSVYSFASILIVFLSGTGFGALLFQWFIAKDELQPVVPKLLLVTAAFSLLSVALADYGESVFKFILLRTGGTLGGIIAAEILVSGVFLFLPALSMGATFGCLAQLLKHQRGGVGAALGLNTLGGAFAPIIFGVFLVPALGLKSSMLVVVIIYCCCSFFLQMRLSVQRQFSLTFSIIVLALTFGVHAGLRETPFLAHAEDEELVEHLEGVMTSVDVVQYPDKSLHLRVNNHFQMGGTTSVYSDRRQAYLPLLLHPDPRKVLCLGVGAGATFASFGSFPDIEATGVELVPEVIGVLPRFSSVTGDLSESQNLQIVNADARRYVMSDSSTFDLVIADLFHPARDGAGSLYTLEHFRAIQSRLADDGIFCQWLPLYQLNLDTLKTITRTFLEVFPEGQMFLAHYSLEQPIVGLIGSNHELKFPENWFHKRVEGKNFVRQMGVHGYDSIYSLLGTFVAGGETLHNWCDGAPVNSDFHPVVTYQAPQILARKGMKPDERLIALVNELPTKDPEAIFGEVVTEEDYLARERMVAYWQARDSFLHLGTNVPKTHDPEKLYRAAGKPLLEVVRKSIDFTSAYYPLVSIAYNLYPVDRASSYQLLRDLERANPLRPEASLLRRKLFVSGERASFQE